MIFAYSSPTHENVAYNFDKVGGALGASPIAPGVPVIGNEQYYPPPLFPSSEGESQFSTQEYTPNSNSFIYPYSNSASYYQGNDVGTQYTTTSGGITVGCAVMMIIFTGNPGNTFQIEVIQHLEYSGQLSQSMVRPTEPDQMGFQLVTGAAQRMPFYTNIASDRKPKPHWEVFKTALTAVWNEMRPVAMSALGRFASKGFAALAL
jgi:hypothetical protein